jgi:energy-coupling factor transporter ATP-binding protein EcfA2
MNGELALAWWKVPRAERRSRAETALVALAADHLADRAARELPGGERRRGHIARSIALRPDALLLDEPFAGLAAPSRAALFTTLDPAGPLRGPVVRRISEEDGLRVDGGITFP